MLLRRLTLCLCVLASTTTLQAQTPASVFSQYCVTCHNARLKTGGLVIDPTELTHVATNADVWEKVIRKLRSASMPPPNSPRPGQAPYDSVATFLEAELDRAAAAKPNSGKLPLLHR